MTTPHHRIEQTLARLTFALLCLLTPAGLVAQDKALPTRPAPTWKTPSEGAEEEIPEVEDDDLCLVSMSFEGGKLSEFITALRRILQTTETKQFHNLIATGAIDRITIPEITVSQVEIGILFAAVARMAEPRYVLHYEVLHEGNGNPVMVVVAEFGGNEVPDDVDEEVVSTFSLRDLTLSLPGDPSEFSLRAETVLTAVQTAIDLSAHREREVTLRYHAESGLLFAKGNEAQLHIVRGVIDVMTSDHERLRARLRLNQMKNALGPTGPAAGNGR